MDHLSKLENQSIYIFREAYSSIKNIAMLWSLGKDSNVMMWLAFKAFFGKIPFPAVHVDTEKKFKEILGEALLNQLNVDYQSVNRIEDTNIKFKPANKK